MADNTKVFVSILSVSETTCVEKGCVHDLVFCSLLVKLRAIPWWCALDGELWCGSHVEDGQDRW